MRTQKNASRVRFAGMAVAVLALVASQPLFAQAKKPAAPPAAGAPAPQGDKVDITDLENKYWAPKDTDFSVVQNRTFSKDHKFSVSPQWGRIINDPYSEGTLTGVTANYFWNERMGVQAMYIAGDMKNKQATDDLATYGSGVQPDHGKFTSYMGIGYNIVPFYAKMSVWGQKIIYFDMAFTPTLGMTEYEQQIEGGNQSKSALTYGLDISQFYFFSRWLAVRVDLKNQWHTEEIAKFRSSGGYAKGQKVTDKNIHDTMFLIGAMFYF